MATPNLYEDNKGKVTKESASVPKVYRYDFNKVYGAGLDIESIMANGGMLLSVGLANFYVVYAFNSTTSYTFFNVTEDKTIDFLEFVIDGNDLKLNS